jgi:hypothetical protein
MIGLLTIAVARTAQGSPLPPDAVSDVLAAANLQRDFQNGAHGVASATMAGCTDFAGDLGVGCGNANADTLGFFSTSVPAPGALTLKDLGQAHADAAVSIASGPQYGLAIRADARARLLYYIEVVPVVALPPGFSAPLPIDIHYALNNSGFAVGGGFTVFSRISVSVNGFNMGGAFTDSQNGSGSVTNTRTVTVVVGTPDPIPDLLVVDLEASGSVSIGDHPLTPDPAGSFTVNADPTFEISPDFPFRDWFILAYSPNLAPAAVPEPGTLLLIGISGPILLGYGLRQWTHGKRRRT